jgi:hypothetical protein
MVEREILRIHRQQQHRAATADGAEQLRFGHDLAQTRFQGLLGAQGGCLSPVKWCNKSGQRSAAVPDVIFSRKGCC